MNKKALSVIMALTLTIVSNCNAFASPGTSTSDALRQTQDNKKELQAKVQDLNNQIDDVIKKIDSNKKDMNKIAADIKNTQLKLEDAEKSSKAQDDLFGKRVRAMYISGEDGYLQVLLASNDLSDFISRIDMITKVIKFDNKIIAELKERKQAIANQKEALNYENKKLEAVRTGNEGTLSKLSNDIKEQKELLSKETEKEKQLMAAEAAESAKQVAINSTGNVTLSRGMSKSNSYSEVLDMDATAYSGDGYTASGAPTRRDPSGYSTIAVDPRVIPLGSTVYVEGYGYAVASDIGGDIIGNRIDLFVSSEDDALSWGRRSVKVYILN